MDDDARRPRHVCMSQAYWHTPHHPEPYRPKSCHPEPHRIAFRQSGTTLLELLLVVAIVGLLTSVALPGYRAMAARQDIASELSRLEGALMLARGTAITRARPVTLCPSDDGVHCGEDWRGKLLIKAGAPSWEGATLHVFAPSRLSSIDFREDAKPVRFLANGRASGHNGTFEVCARENTGARLVLSNFGRIRTEKGRCAGPSFPP
ncbi:MAG: prepilin-type N-terminal cleavage/methylation domain-containing protein [Gammaproteobacteria bacterium]|nr:prepilin-type N-terminal cleavage/methylation domain-containing protein [Gammaproteobacteria bacterium]